MESGHWCHVALLCKIVLFAVCCQCCLSGDCPSDGRTWVIFNNSCYHFVHGEENIAKSYSRESAKDLCHGYDLVTIHDMEENQFIVHYSPQVWKGNMNVWLGMFFDTDRDMFMWKDDQPVEFFNWDESMDSDDNIETDTCAALSSSTGQWLRVSCAEGTENAVICKTLQTPETKKNANNHPLLMTLVILSVVVILGVSAALWFLHQKHNLSMVHFTSFEYHPPFHSPGVDEASLVEAEETEELA